MGRGDKRSKRGKIRLGSFGVNRPRKSRNASVTVAATAKPSKASAAKKETKEQQPKAKRKVAAKKKTSKKDNKETE